MVLNGFFIYLFVSQNAHERKNRGRKRSGNRGGERGGLNDGWMGVQVGGTNSTQQISTASLLYYLFLTLPLVFSKYFYGSR